MAKKMAKKAKKASRKPAKTGAKVTKKSAPVRSGQVRSKNRSGIMPIGDRALIKLVPREEKTLSGIIIPETVSSERTDNRRGTVIAVGEGKVEDGKRIAMSVKEGDEVLFQWGEKIEIDREEYYLVSESNILAIFNR